MILSQGYSIPTVVLPDSPTPCERFAAEELQKYLAQITGVTLPVCTPEETMGAARILLGSPTRNRATAQHIPPSEFAKAVPGSEGMLLQNYGEEILVVAGGDGSDGRSTLYAVYELLERYAACSFAAYTHPDCPGGEFVPREEKLTLSDISYVKVDADLPYRTAIIQYGDAAGSAAHGLNLSFLDWLVKNRYNRILTWMSVYEEMKESGVLAEIARRGLHITTGHHGAAEHFLPQAGNRYFPEPYYETHPEYYRLCEDGTRFHMDGKHYGQCVFCSRNDAIYDRIAENILSWISENPLVDTIAFWPQDGVYPDCQCDACRRYSKVENYTYFMNELARRMERACPHVKIDMLLYTDLWECPKGLCLSPNLMVDEALWHHTGLRTAGCADGSSLIGTHFEDNIRVWRETGAQAVYYDYCMGNYSARNRLLPMADEMQAFARRNRELGISGMGTQIECFNLWNNLFNFYSFARTAYDTSRGMDENLARFTRIFGRGGAAIAEIIRLAEACLDGQEEIPLGGWYLMHHIDRATVYRLFEDALALETEAGLRNNIRLFRMAFRYSDLECAQVGAEIDTPYEAVKFYPDITPELLAMTRFDSFHYQDPGYGIMIPVRGEGEPYTDDVWYSFE